MTIDNYAFENYIFEKRKFSGTSPTIIPFQLSLPEDMLIKNEIITFLKQVKKDISQIKSVYYLKKDNEINLYTIIEKENADLEKKIFNRITKLYDLYNDIEFDFLVIPKRLENDCKPSMDKII